ncbi:MAG: FAD-linked oxidase C-terminal domain-containing protein, partial [Ferrovibrio sp.]
WVGGLVWLTLPPAEDAHAALVRGAVAAYGGGHATLFRADTATRAAVPVFQPQPEALAALSRRVKDSFDPMNILNPGRMVAGT